RPGRPSAEASSIRNTPGSHLTMILSIADPGTMRSRRAVLSRRVLSGGLSLALAAAVVGCTASSPGTGADAPGGRGHRLSVLASFYPLEYVAGSVGGDRVEVSSLTPPGAEPHDVELSPRQVRLVGEADLVLYLSGMQPSVDQAV